MKYVRIFLLLSAWSATENLLAQELKPGREKVLAMSIEINSPLDSVWSRFATESGRRKFFAPATRFELATLGQVDILFNPAASEGQRGAENNRLLTVQDKQMISF